MCEGNIDVHDDECNFLDFVGAQQKLPLAPLYP